MGQQALLGRCQDGGATDGETLCTGWRARRDGAIRGLDIGWVAADTTQTEADYTKGQLLCY